MWQKEIEEILAQANTEPVVSWEKFFETIKPMILMVMGVGVGVMVAAIMLPMFKLAQGL